MNLKYNILFLLINAQNEYVKPGNSDHRSPCPGLNTLANHGYINRNGTGIKFNDIAAGLKNIFAIKDDLVKSLTSALGPGMPATSPDGTIDLLNIALHNFIEHDASLVHDDFFFGNPLDTIKVNQNKVAELVATAERGFVSADSIAAHKKKQLIFSQQNNLIFDIPDTPLPILSSLQYAEPALLLSVIGNGTHISEDSIQQFLGEERLPDNYVPRAPFIGIKDFDDLTAEFKSKVQKAPSQVLKIPSDEDSTSMSIRSARLSALQEEIKNGPVFVTINNRPGELWQYANGPQPQSLLWQNAAFKGISNIRMRIGLASTAATNKIKEKLIGANPLPVSTLDDLTNLHNNWGTTIARPSIIYDWQSDKSFGDDRRTFGGYKLEIETQNVLKLSDELVNSITKKKFDKLLKDRKIFKIDYTGMGQYLKSASRVNSKNPNGQNLASVYAQFFLSEDKNLMPLAIKIEETGLVYTPLDAPEDWMFAKLAFSAAEGVFLPFEHFSVTHMIYLGAQTELIRHVSNSHPLYALLNHHFKDNYGNVILGIQALLQGGTPVDTVYASGGVGATLFCGDRFKTFDFNAQKIENVFDNSGTADLPGYKYRDDLLEIRKAYGKFTSKYFSLFYKNDKEVVSDKELQNFAKATSDMSAGGLRGFPSSFKKVKDLADTVADIIVQLTAQHNVLNGESTWNGQAFPAVPKALYGPLPLKKGIESARQFLAPDGQLISLELEILAKFNLPININTAIGNSYENELSDKADKAIKDLQKDLAKISEKIEDREKNNPRAYTVLNPSKIPYQVWI